MPSTTYPWLGTSSPSNAAGGYIPGTAPDLTPWLTPKYRRGQPWRRKLPQDIIPWPEPPEIGTGDSSAQGGLMGDVFGGNDTPNTVDPTTWTNPKHKPGQPWRRKLPQDIIPWPEPPEIGTGDTSTLGGLMGNVFGGPGGGDNSGMAESTGSYGLGTGGGVSINDWNIGDPLINEPGQTLYDGGGNAPIADQPGGTTTTTPAQAFDFWTSIRDILGDSVDESQFSALQQSFAARNNWRVPKNAQDMLDTAKLMKLLGMEDEASSLAFQAINMGYRAPKWDLNTLFGPLFASWGLQYGQ